MDIDTNMYLLEQYYASHNACDVATSTLTDTEALLLQDKVINFLERNGKQLNSDTSIESCIVYKGLKYDIHPDSEQVQCSW
jgi:hypothetical protein